jgi:hypothetical protein
MRLAGERASVSGDRHHAEGGPEYSRCCSVAPLTLSLSPRTSPTKYVRPAESNSSTSPAISNVVDTIVKFDLHQSKHFDSR